VDHGTSQRQYEQQHADGSDDADAALICSVYP
jgi:hypothetical protein